VEPAFGVTSISALIDPDDHREIEREVVDTAKDARAIVDEARRGDEVIDEQLTDRKAEQQFEIKMAFDLFDADESGEIDSKELSSAMAALGITATPEEIHDLTGDIDDDDDFVQDEGEKKGKCGIIEYDEFYKFMQKKFLDYDPKQEVDRMFHMFDDDHTGKITKDNLKRTLLQVGQKPSDEELDTLLDIIGDKDESGKSLNAITIDNFGGIMRKYGMC